MKGFNLNQELIHYLFRMTNRNWTVAVMENYILPKSTEYNSWFDDLKEMNRC